MQPLALHEFHHQLNAQFTGMGGMEAVSDYGDVLRERTALSDSSGVLDLSFRGRLCLTGADRVRFLHGQVTNDVRRLAVGEGCYAAVVTAKGRMQSDLNIYCLQDELLLDFEPGLAETVSQRLEKYIVADDVEVVEVTSIYGLLSVQGSKAETVLRSLELFQEIPPKPFQFRRAADGTLGELYLMNQARLGLVGFDLFVPVNSLGAVANKLVAAARAVGGRACGWTAFEIARIEAGVPRFGLDMNEGNIPLECGIESRAVSYTKGCYIGQEVINRIHSIGHVNRELRGLRLANDLPALPVKGDKLFYQGKEAGFITSAVKSPGLKANIALGYVRREANKVGTELTVLATNAESVAKVVELPF